MTDANANAHFAEESFEIHRVVRPGYRSVLPRVFPYKRDLSREDAYACITYLDEMISEGELGDGGDEDISFSVTTHKFSVGGNVTLWLSESAAKIILGDGAGMLSSVESTQIGSRR